MSGKPLEGIRVVELGQLIAGPFAGKMLAEFGAEVIRTGTRSSWRFASAA